MLPFLITPIAFVTWCVGIAKARATVLQVSKALFVMLFIAGVLWTAFGFPATLRICGASRAVPVAIQCLLPPALIAFAAHWRNPHTPNGSFLVHWSVFAWLSWSALPWYGELL